MTLYAVITVAQYAAIGYLLFIALENSRAYTLSKNSEWLIDNKEFLNRYKSNSAIFLVLSFALAAGTVFYALAVHSTELAWGVKNGAVFLILAIGSAFYSAKERKIAQEIPQPAIRIASLNKRNISSFIPKQVQITAVLFTAVTLLFILISAFTGKISLAELTFNLLFASLLYGICYVTIFHTVQKREPHPDELKPFSSEAIVVNYRTLSVQILTGAIFVCSILLIAFAAVQWGDKSLIITPIIQKCYGWFGETVPMELISKYEWDMGVSLLSCLLFISMGRSRTLQNYRSSKLY